MATQQEIRVEKKEVSVFDALAPQNFVSDFRAKRIKEEAKKSARSAKAKLEKKRPQKARSVFEDIVGQKCFEFCVREGVEHKASKYFLKGHAHETRTCKPQTKTNPFAMFANKTASKLATAQN